ncbi:hypothetical protein HPC49_17285 [Pyxidicoccus fallax]|uniref:Uncharacterized protein n=1 Tax=Pyxidicoccus fallax TaxID=394095 RepID=A0A848LDA3_9BACT|nr:hypothetical protein [Pyxidicoccus fallax]NMO14795.1 hypothetical protein [Pyxidicoccus fallax]NPC79967.1 hypothetical protein [Pyxidicoccus fallax]
MDAEVLEPIIATMPVRPVVDIGGPKGSLKPKARDRRVSNKIQACYVRDRDFDFDPPLDLARPTEDSRHGTPSTILGWRWCRHELENYLLEPLLVAAATGWNEADYSQALLGAARSITPYTASRWVMGVARRSLPPFKELPTRPDAVSNNEIRIPSDCSEKASSDWVRQQIELFRQQVDSSLAANVIQASFDLYLQRLSAQSQPHEILVWHSGKDLLAAMQPLIAKRPESDPVSFRRTLRDWVRDNPTNTLAFLPEWKELLTFLAA